MENSNELKKHKQIRKILKGKLTKQIHFIERFGAEATISNIHEAEIRLTAMNEYINEFKTSADMVFMIEQEEKQLEEIATELINFEEEFFRTKAKFIEVIKKVKPEPVPQQASNNNSTQQAVQVFQQPTLNAKLPDFQLPKFDGKIENFPEFKDAFTAMVDKLKIPEVEKLMYLVSSCKGGEAEDFLKTYQIVDDNYEIAWNDLCERFNNKRLIADKHFSELLKCKPVNNPLELGRFVNCYTVHLKQLKQMINSTEELWNLLVVHLATWRLDEDSRRVWETQLKRNELPDWDKMEKFLQERLRVQEQLQFNCRQQTMRTSNLRNRNPAVQKTTTFVATETKLKCPVCEQEHLTFKCPAFNKLTISEKRNKVKEKELCFNCLQNNHTASNCPSKNTCKECNGKHHTLLHEKKQTEEPATIPEIRTFVTQTTKATAKVLLATAIVNIENWAGDIIPCRAVLDSASESHLITEHMVQVLRLKKTRVNVDLTGINLDSKGIRSMVEAKIQSRTSKYNSQLSCLVVSSMPTFPSQELNVPAENLDTNLELADPSFFKSNPVDLIIGAEIMLDIIKDEKKTIVPNQLAARDSELGWIVYGKLNPLELKMKISNSACFMTTQNDLNELLRKFWEVETIVPDKPYTTEEKYCEELFTTTTKRDTDGRIIVQLPMKNNISQLKSNRATAIRRLHAMEKWLDQDPEHRRMYNEFMSEYERLGHMKVISTANDSTIPVVHYLPHHPVFKPTSTTTKLRVVFNASCKDSNGLTLNNALCIGPKVQQDLFQILVRFCQFPLVVIADVQMMYRQTLVDPEQTHMQRIVWRDESTKMIKDYALQTITYGTAPASYLATRCLKELAVQNREKYPEACSIIENDFYMDDMVTGFTNKENGTVIQKQIIEILESAKYHLRKWMSNCPEMLETIHQSDRETINLHDMDGAVKTLGLCWKPETDELSYNVKPIEENSKTLTKRSVASDIAKWFDPLGRINPVIVIAKIFLQKLFIRKLDWDDILPPDCVTEWHQIISELEELNQIKFGRCCLLVDSSYFELHGFSDASEAAFGACIYLLSRNNEGETKVQLLCAKSRVASIEKVTMPRLELLGALLLAELYEKVTKSLRLTINRVHLWTDSTVVLYWIRMDEGRLKDFVLHRIQKIKARINDKWWRHVPTKQNPADYISRGLTPSALLNTAMWWNGPMFLMSTEDSWPSKILQTMESIPEQKTLVVMVTTIQSVTILESCSSLNRIKRVFGYVSRFLNNICRSNNKRTGVITSEERQNGFQLALKILQNERFPEEIKSLSASKPIANKSAVKSLNVFLGNDKLIRVGGRLRNANINYDQQHPVLLPNHHNMTKVIVRHIHIMNLHCGQNSLVSFVRQQFWPIRCKDIARQVIKDCLTCAKLSARPGRQLMGNLPEYRVTLDHPFYHTGVDYAGPINIRSGLARSRTNIKSWIAVFVCMSTKATHLELVTGLTTEAFLAAMDRFIARRGVPGHMHSDQGTNFVGADAELKRIHRVVCQDAASGDLKHNEKYEDIKWHNIPAHSPNFGGLWESTVKIVKKHLTRVIGDRLLDYEEMCTVLCRIEAIINSRPITPLSDDPNDLSALTPAHFLVGRPLNTRPQHDVLSVPDNRLKRFQLMQKISQDFWKRFQIDYLHNLQQRTKWFSKVESIKPGTLVTIKEDNLPPLKWQLGRVEKVISGNDGLVRVALVRTSKGVYDRCVSKLCPLFVETSFQRLQHV